MSTPTFQPSSQEDFIRPTEPPPQVTANKGPDFAVAAQAAYENAFRLGRVMFEADYDTLTGLLKAEAFKKTVAQQIATLSPGDQLTVQAADVDSFSDMNNIYGHAGGDELLVYISRAFQAAYARDKDSISARLHGDEFATTSVSRVAAKHPDKEKRTLGVNEATQKQAERLNGALADILRGTRFEKHNLRISLGGATYEEGDTPESLLAKADLAMYRDKYGNKSEAAAARPDDVRYIRDELIPSLRRYNHRIEPWLLKLAAQAS